MDDLEIRSLIYNIMDKALVKNARTKADIFVGLRAHVKKLNIEIYKEGWSENIYADYFKSVDIQPLTEEVKEIVINNLVDICEVIDSI